MKVEVTKLESLADVTVSQYMDYVSKLKIKDGKPTVDLSTQDSHALRIFCNVPYEVQPKTKASDLNVLLESIGEAFGVIPKFYPTFEMDGIKYGFIPKLDIITTGEYVDLDTYINKAEDANKAMAVMYRPIVEEFDGKYIIEDYKGTGATSEIMKEAPLSAYLGAQVFFWNLEVELSKITLKSLEIKMNNQKKEDSVTHHGSVKNGVGTVQLMQQLTMILPNMKISQRDH